MDIFGHTLVSVKQRTIGTLTWDGWEHFMGAACCMNCVEGACNLCLATKRKHK